MARPEKQARTIAVVAYLTLVGALISISMNAEPKYPFGRFHARQAFGLHRALERTLGAYNKTAQEKTHSLNHGFLFGFVPNRPPGDSTAGGSVH